MYIKTLINLSDITKLLVKLFWFQNDGGNSWNIFGYKLSINALFCIFFCFSQQMRPQLQEEFFSSCRTFPTTSSWMTTTRWVWERKSSDLCFTTLLWQWPFSKSVHTRAQVRHLAQYTCNIETFMLINGRVYSCLKQSLTWLQNSNMSCWWNSFVL